MTTTMKTKNTLCGLMSGLLLLLSLGLAGPTIALSASAQTSPPPLPDPRVRIETDKPDYLPGDTAVISGLGFTPGEAVVLQVLHADGTDATGTDHEPWTVTANELGGYKRRGTCARMTAWAPR